MTANPHGRNVGLGEPAKCVNCGQVWPCSGAVRIPKWWDRNFPTWQYTAMSDNWVWCDEHSQIHEAGEDLFQEGNKNCNRENWRPVYVASDEVEEEF